MINKCIECIISECQTEPYNQGTFFPEYHQRLWKKPLLSCSSTFVFPTDQFPFCVVLASITFRWILQCFPVSDLLIYQCFHPWSSNSLNGLNSLQSPWSTNCIFHLRVICWVVFCQLSIILSISKGRNYISQNLFPSMGNEGHLLKI